MFAFRLAAIALIAATPVIAQQAKKPAAKTPAAKPAAPKPAAAKPAAAKPKPAPAKPKPQTPLVSIPPLSHDEKAGFSVLQVAVPDADKFIAEWKLGGGGKSATTKTIANRPLFTFLIFRGCKANAEARCDIVADFVITRPDGTINDENKGVVVWDKAAPTDPRKPYLGDGALGYGVDDEGPFGDYRVVATVTDRVAAVTLTTELTLTIAPGKAAVPAKPVKKEPAKPDPATPETTDPATPTLAEPATPDPATPPATEPTEPPAK